jgi:hypothetical protein
MHKRTTICILTGLPLAFAVGCGTVESDPREGVASEDETGSERDPEARAEVDALLASMRDGSWEGSSLPELDWRHVDTLLDRAESDAPLLRFPTHVFSSQYQTRCSEGIMALWVVEAIRRQAPNGFPSLNPLCLRAGDGTDIPWEEASDRNRGSAARAYRQWWKSVKSEDVEERRERNPLAGTGLSWF